MTNKPPEKLFLLSVNYFLHEKKNCKGKIVDLGNVVKSINVKKIFWKIMPEVDIKWITRIITLSLHQFEWINIHNIRYCINKINHNWTQTIDI